jgi:hypothetical protein
MKKRLFYLGLTIFTIIFALFIRNSWSSLPYFINFWIGDFLWAIMLFWACRFVFLHSNRLLMSTLLIVFCWCIESSQLLHTDWLDAFRNTTFGGLLLGHGFLWSDIIAYTCGVIVGYLIDAFFILKNNKIFNI